MNELVDCVERVLDILQNDRYLGMFMMYKLQHLLWSKVISSVVNYSARHVSI